MRDIGDYADCYSINDFEQYQVEYRRKKVIEILEKYNPDLILEIGCGLDPIFRYWGSEKNGLYMSLLMRSIKKHWSYQVAWTTSQL